MRKFILKQPVIAVLLLFFVCVFVYAVCSAMSYGIGGMWASVVMDVSVALIAFLYVKYGTGFDEKKAKVGIWHVTAGIFVVFFFYISMALTANLTYELFQDVSYDAYMASREDASMTNQVIALLTTIIGAPISEELLFRGGIYGTLRKTRLPLIATAFASSFLFAICHGTLTHIAPAVIMGMLCCSVYECTGKLRWSMLLHCYYNVLSYVTAGVLVPDWLGSIPAVIVQCGFWVTFISCIFLLCERKNINILQK